MALFNIQANPQEDSGAQCHPRDPKEEFLTTGLNTTQKPTLENSPKQMQQSPTNSEYTRGTSKPATMRAITHTLRGGLP